MNHDAPLTRYPKAFISSQIFLSTLSIGKFPYDVFSLPALIKKHYGYSIIISSLTEYNKFKNSLNMDSYSLTDGECRYFPETGDFCIIYNEKQCKNRIRFTIMHEIAHIILGHVGVNENRIMRYGELDYSKLYYEGEANTFAGNALAPPIVIHSVLAGKPFNSAHVAAYFKLSKAAAKDYREKDYYAWLHMNMHVSESSLWEHHFTQTYTKHCPICHSNFIGEDVRYCKICGNKDLAVDWVADTVEYPSVKVDDKGMAIDKCQRCGKEHLRSRLCRYCGVHLINECTNKRCKAPTDGDARFCSACGWQTTYYCDCILPKYDKSFPQKDF